MRFIFPCNLQFGIQLQQDYEDTKAEMPWLQLEDDNLDATKSAEVTKRTKTPNTEVPTIITVSLCTVLGYLTLTLMLCIACVNICSFAIFVRTH